MTLKEGLKNSFIGGLVLLAPFIISIIAIDLFLNWTSGLTNVVVQTLNIGQYTGKSALAGQVIVLISTAVAITLTGLVARSRTGRALMGGFGRLVNIVPLYRTLYFSLKHFSDSLVENRSKYEKVVAVEYPQKGLYRLGFTTSRTKQEIQQLDDRELLNVFMPNSPNPTAGLMAMMPEERIHEIDLSVREAFKLVMTTGIAEEKVEGIIPDLE